MVARAVGMAIRRVEDRRFLTGAGRYVQDVRPRGTLHLAFVRSPYPSARLVRVDAAAARDAPGVIEVLTSGDLSRVGDIPTIPLPFVRIPPHPALARERVAAVGEPIVAVRAHTRGPAGGAGGLGAI